MATAITAVLDASNVAWGHVHARGLELERRARPPMRGLVACVNYWIDNGHIPRALCPGWWTKSFEGEDGSVLKRLVEAGIVHSCPSGSHDDYFILQFAFQLEQKGRAVVIVTNDNMRDHISSHLQLDALWIQERRLKYMFVEDEFIPDVTGFKLAMDRLANAKVSSDAAMDVEGPPPEHFSLPSAYAKADHMEDVCLVFEDDEDMEESLTGEDSYTAPRAPAAAPPLAILPPQVAPTHSRPSASAPRFAAPDLLPCERRQLAAASVVAARFPVAPISATASVVPTIQAPPLVQQHQPKPTLTAPGVKFASADLLPFERRAQR